MLEHDRLDDAHTARCFYFEKKYHVAYDLFTIAIDNCDEPNNAKNYYYRSDCLYKMKRYSEARDDAMKCLSIRPSLIKGHIKLGKALYSLGKYDDAAKSIKHYIDRSSLESSKDVMIARELLSHCLDSASQVGGDRVDISDKLPQEMLFHICEYLGTKDLLSCSLINKLFSELSNQDLLWRRICDLEFTGKVLNEYTKQVHNVTPEHTYKKLYYLAVSDAKKSTTTVQEVCKFRWEFEVLYGNMAAIKGNCKFDEEGIYEVTIDMYGTLQADQMCWKLDDGMYLVVNNFPSLCFARRRDWGLMFTNELSSMEAQQEMYKPLSEI
ncbi:heat shock protein STI1 [Acrasis kona]|uniref:Heat shock protein STI1 n=1 Tax=Acrasis kona TaxID=1008807 RepID=A0AAW2ZQL5_9EUKA